jgi:hypothetical protein
MVIPQWSTIGLLVVFVMQLILVWRDANKTGKSLRTDVVPSALMAVAMTIIFVRSFFEDVPKWMDPPLAIFTFLILAIVLTLRIIQFKRYMKTAWWLDWRRDK